MKNKKAYIFGSIFLFSNKLQNSGDKLFKEISMKQWILLMAIIQSGIESPTLTQVSDIMGYSRQNVKKLALHLENKGLIQLTKDSSDSRVLRIVLTEKCFVYFQGREKKEEEFIRNLYEGFTEEEVNSMFLNMKKLEKNILKINEER